MGKESNECVLILQQTRKRATVSDAAVMWAGKVQKERRGSEGMRREVAESERKISRRGS